MRRKHTAPLLVFAGLLLAVFAPAAQGAYWAYEGEPITEPVEVTFEGSLQQAQSPHIGCKDVVGTMVLSPGDQGEITDVSYSGCDLRYGFATVEALDLPWSIEARAPQSGAYVYTDEVFEKVANGYESHTFDSTWSLIPDNPEEAASLSVSGYNQVIQQTVSGSFDLTPEGALQILP